MLKTNWVLTLGLATCQLTLNGGRMGSEDVWRKEKCSRWCSWPTAGGLSIGVKDFSVYINGVNSKKTRRVYAVPANKFGAML